MLLFDLSYLHLLLLSFHLNQISTRAHPNTDESRDDLVILFYLKNDQKQTKSFYKIKCLQFKNLFKKIM